MKKLTLSSKFTYKNVLLLPAAVLVMGFLPFMASAAVLGQISSSHVPAISPTASADTVNSAIDKSMASVINPITTINTNTTPIVIKSGQTDVSTPVGAVGENATVDPTDLNNQKSTTTSTTTTATIDTTTTPTDNSHIDTNSDKDFPQPGNQYSNKTYSSPEDYYYSNPPTQDTPSVTSTTFATPTMASTIITSAPVKKVVAAVRKPNFVSEFSNSSSAELLNNIVNAFSYSNSSFSPKTTKALGGFGGSMMVAGLGIFATAIEKPKKSYSNSSKTQNLKPQ